VTDEAAPAKSFSHPAARVHLVARFTHDDFDFTLGKYKQVPGRVFTAKQNVPFCKRLAVGNAHDPVDHILVQSPEQIRLSDVHGNLILVMRNGAAEFSTR
jgi:hypothetical protein